MNFRHLTGQEHSTVCLRTDLTGVFVFRDHVKIHSYARTIKDINGQSAPRITYQIGKFEKISQDFFVPLVAAMCGASGAQLFAAVPQALATSLGGVAPPAGEHTMGGMQMGVDPATSVVDANGRMHQLDNVYVADSSVFVTSSGSNPTLTIMAVALWIARGLTGQRH